MPLFTVRRERCIPVEVVVEAPTMDEAEAAAYDNLDKWDEGCAYWQDLETLEHEDGEYEPAIVVEGGDEEDEG